MNRSEEMLDGNIRSLLWAFSLPAIVGMIVNSLYNVIDRIFVGRGIGSEGIAATTVAFPVMIVLLAVSVLIGVGATALISIRLGEGSKDDAEKIAGNAMTLLILLPVLCTIVFFLFTDQILIALGASPTVLPYARDFTEIIMLGSAIGSISMGMNNFIRAEGNPKMAMYTQLLGAGANIFLNYVFIFKFGWGMKGSAFATIMAQSISAVWVLSYFFTNKSLLKIRIKNLIPSRPILTGIMAIGFAPFAMQLANSVQNLILNKTLVAYGGDMALSAVGILVSIATLLFMPVLGLAQGAQPIIGFNYGARKYGRVRETWRLAVWAGTFIASAGYLAIRIWPQQLVGLFSEGDVVLTNLTVHAMLVYLALIPIVGFQVISSTYFQAVGKARQATILSLSRQVLFLIPCLLILPHFWGIEGVWRTGPIADLLSVALTATLIFFEMKKLRQDEEKIKSENQINEITAVRGVLCGSESK
ncbi:MAG: MATE family efflux transporter [Syntrophomonadaceae bacterium]|jgi:putative MATE family efflux protein